MEQKKRIWVAVGVIENERGDIFIAKRSSDRHQGDRWEFPGGKVESGEDLLTALDRELWEEIGIRVQGRQRAKTNSHSERSLRFDTSECDGKTPRTVKPFAALS